MTILKIYFSLIIVLIIYGCSTSKMQLPIGNQIKMNYAFGFSNNSFTDSSSEIRGSYGDFYIIKKAEKHFNDSNGVVTRGEDRFSYFIFNQKDSNGFSIVGYEKKNWTMLDKDSFFSNEMFKVFENAENLSRNYYSAINTLKFKSSDSLKVGLVETRDSSYNDTAIYYFDKKYRNLNFTIDKYLDSVSDSKCIKKRLLYYNKIKDHSEYGQIYRELSVEIKPGNYFRKEELDSLTRMYTYQKLQR